jgi:hypothetical protein
MFGSNAAINRSSRRFCWRGLLVHSATATLLALTVCLSARSQVFISEYVEGSLTNRAIGLSELIPSVIC